MITRTVTVKSTEFVDTKDKKKQYMKAVLTGDKGDNTQSIFDPDIQKMVRDAQAKRLPLEVQLDKNEQGFWNIKTARVVETPTDAPKTPVEAIKPEKGEYASQEVGMWWKEVGEFIRNGQELPPKVKGLEVLYFERMQKVLLNFDK